MVMMVDNELVPIGKQIAFPGLEKEEVDQFIPTKAGGKITAKMRAFVAEYLKTHELAASAIKAGYAPKYAGSIANRLVQKSQVAELIRQEEEKALKLAGVDRVRILLEMSNLAYSNLQRLFREDGTLKDPSEWDPETAAAVSSVEVFEEFEGTGKNRRQVGYVKKIKFWDKPRALEMLAKNQGLLKDSIVFPDKDGNPMAPGVQIQNRIEVVFINAPGEKGVRPAGGQEVGG